MISHRNRDKPTDRDLVALADGSLPADRRARVARVVAGSPELTARIEAQRRALAAIRGAAAEPAPAALRARLELARDPELSHRRRRSGVRRLAVTSVAVAMATVTSAVVLMIGGGAPGGPTVAAAATLGTREPVAPTYAALNDRGTLPGVIAAGIPFPDWAREFGFKASGVRHDRLDGRFATTVFYVGDGRRIAYTIVSGSPLAAGTATGSMVWGGVRLRSFVQSGRLVVTWLRNGHTCVLSGSDASLTTLARLASWQQDPVTY